MKTVNGSGVRHELWFRFCTFLFGIIFLLFFPLIIGFVYGDKVVASTLNLSVSSDIVDLDISPLGVTGSFAKSDNINIAASTTNATGYTLGISASSSDNYDRLINSSSTSCDNAGTNTISTTGTKSTNCLTSINEATTEEAFGALNGSNYNGLWGYLPSKYNSTSNSSFLPAPHASGDILDKTDSANATANTYTIAIGARVDSTVKMDSYSNTYNVLLVSNAIPYTITYNDGVVSNMPVDVNSTSETTSVAISNLVPVREGHTFLGWCTVAPTTINNIDTCVNGTVYNAGDTWIISDTNVGNNNLILNAMWRKTGGGGADATITVNIEVGATSVTFSNNTDGSVTANSDGTKVHLISGETYTIFGEYIEHSAFSEWTITSGVIDNTSSSVTTFVPDGDATLTLSVDYVPYMQDFTLDTCVATASNKDVWVEDNRDNEKYTVRYINGKCWMTTNLNLGSTSDTMTLTPNDTNIKSNYTLSQSTMSNYKLYKANNKICSSSDPCYTYYYWQIAIAGTSVSSSAGSSSNYDICPKGWRLPTKSELTSLKNVYSTGQTLTSSPFNAVYSGYLSDGSFSGLGVRGGLLSSTRGAKDGGGSYLYYTSTSSGITDTYGYNEKYEYGIRCIAK